MGEVLATFELTSQEDSTTILLGDASQETMSALSNQIWRLVCVTVSDETALWKDGWRQWVQTTAWCKLVNEWVSES